MCCRSEPDPKENAAAGDDKSVEDKPEEETAKSAEKPSGDGAGEPMEVTPSGKPNAEIAAADEETETAAAVSDKPKMNEESAAANKPTEDKPVEENPAEEKMETGGSKFALLSPGC